MSHWFSGRGRPSSARSVDSLVAAFDEGWGRPGGGLAEFWARSGGGRPLGDLSALVKVDLRRRFARGERPAASTYLDQFPELAEEADRVLSLVYEEFCLLDDHRAAPSVAEFCRRYGRWKDSIASQLAYHRRFSQVATAERPEVAYPVVGERFGSYQLRSVLGRGGTARVYLAADGELGDREVVLKLTPTLGMEPSILASLEHRNIVPIHSVARPEGSALQGICMPYRPGITLEQLLVQLLASGPPRRAQIIWDLLDLDGLPRDQAALAWRDFPMGGTYTEGLAWLGLEMAQALAYLHGRGFYHRDVKPANILLSARGGPLLIDFNLAHSPHTPEQAREAMKGGTLPYMAPEQLQAFLDPGAWPLVGPQADVYSLGLVLRELITGVRPDLPDPTLPLDRSIADLRDRRPEYAGSSRDLRPDLPPSLDAIVRRCLAFDPADRYASAQQLGDDLRLFLERKPLAGAANPSALERGLNWAYRRRRAASSLLLMGIVLSLGILINPGRPGPGPSAAPARRVVRVVRPTQAPLPPNPLLREPPPAGRARRPVGEPFDALKDPTFRRSLEILAVNLPDDLGEAGALLRGLAREHPESAWPLVFLVQIELQRSPNSLEARSWMALIDDKLDAKAASLHCLGFRPRRWKIDASRPHLTLGNLASADGDDQEAREHYERVLDLNDHQFIANRYMARQAMLRDRRDDAIGYYSKAFELQEINNQAAELSKNFFEEPTDLEQLLLEGLDHALDQRDVGRARSMITLLRRHHEILEQGITPRSASDRRFPYLLALDRGRLASGLAHLAALEGRTEEYQAESLAARRELERAEALAGTMPRAPEPDPPAGEVLPFIRAARAQLDARIASCEVIEEPVPSPTR